MKDILLNEGMDLQFNNGDFLIGESTNQNVELLFVSTPGDWKQYLETGIAIKKSVNGNIDRFLDRTIRIQLEADGYNIEKLIISETGITIDGSYE